MASPLDALPLELVDEIIKPLCQYCTPVDFQYRRYNQYASAEALLQLTRTCKLLSTVATPHLYHRPLTSRWWLLARTLVARPDLALHVRSLLDNEKVRERPFAGREPPEAFPAEVLRRFPDSALARATDEERDAIVDTRVPWQVQTSWCDSSETLDMLVSLCTAVREIDARTRTFNTPNMFIWSAPGSLPELKHLTLRHLSLGPSLSLNLLAQVATAGPNLTRVALYDLKQDAGGPQIMPDMPNLVALSLWKAAVCPQSLENLLAACPNLRSFAYLSAPIGAHEPVTRSKMARALVRAAPNLTSLVLSLHPGGGVHLDAADTAVPSLAGLPRLETLTLSLDCVLPAGVSTAAPVLSLDPELLVRLLPTSVHTLSLPWTGLNFKVLSPVLLRLASATPSRLPSLKFVYVTEMAKPLKTVAEEVAEVKAAFAAQGVEISIRNFVGRSWGRQ